MELDLKLTNELVQIKNAELEKWEVQTCGLPGQFLKGVCGGGVSDCLIIQHTAHLKHTDVVN